MINLFTSKEVKNLDELSVKHGVSLSELMENAGKASFEVIIDKIIPSLLNFNNRITVLCGPGNNGGDGFVIAKKLIEKNFDVKVCSPFNKTYFNSIALEKLEMSDFDLLEASQDLFKNSDLIIDALFGIGLNRDIDKKLIDLIDSINKEKNYVVSIDIPSGLETDTGEKKPNSINANHTITFQSPKPCHFLLPGKINTGELSVVDIGIPKKIFKEVKKSSNIFLNTSDLWKNHFPWPKEHDHKYSRGHLLVQSGDQFSTGASRLASLSALRIGAGVVTLASSDEAALINASHLTSVMIKNINNISDFINFSKNRKVTSLLIGPGCGVTDYTKKLSLNIIELGLPAVLDADALSVFKDDPDELFSCIKKYNNNVILTPHEGEFNRIFKDTKGSKLSVTRDAAKESGATIIYKGNDSVISNPEGLLAISDRSSPFLATAGSGDVLAGICAGLLSQGMDSFLAACAGQWFHKKIGEIPRPGMIADDMPGIIENFLPTVLGEIYEKS